jgi:hypothetical protein
VRFALAATLAALSIPAFAQETSGSGDTSYIKISPQQIAEIFCLSIVGNEFAPIESLVTPDLKAAIADAEAKDAAYEKANPGEMPPLGDGIPWQDAPDYAAGCKVGAVTITKDSARVAIAHSFPEYPDADFTDTLMLKLVADPASGENLWRIDNVAYASEGDLRTVIKTAFAD